MCGILSSSLRCSINVVFGQFIEPLSIAINLNIGDKTTFPTEFTRWLRKQQKKMLTKKINKMPL